MDKFLKDYIKMIAEVRGITLTQKQLRQIVNSIECNEVVWEVMDEHINDEIDNII